MRSHVVAIGLLAVLLSSEALAKTDIPDTKNPYIPLVAKLYDSLEFDTVISTLQKASNWPNNTPQDLLWIELMDGVLQAGAGNEANALGAFKRALLLDANAQLPVKGSAKLRALFGQARSDLNLTPSPAPETKVAQASPTSPPPPTRSGEIPSVESQLAPIRPPSPQSIGLLVGLRGEAEILGRGLTSAVTAEVGRGPFAGALTILVQRAPGVRVEGRYYFLNEAIRPYAAAGVTTFFPDTAGRLGAGVVLALGSVHLFADAAYERIFNPSVSYAPNVLLFSLGAGWRFSLAGSP